MRTVLFFIAIWIGIPVLVYFSVKFGTVAYFKAKEFMKKELH